MFKTAARLTNLENKKFMTFFVECIVSKKGFDHIKKRDRDVSNKFLFYPLKKIFTRFNLTLTSFI